MATRAIVTSHPDVECDFCGRRLLRGEQPEVYLAGSSRRVVCELCTPRAVDEGWLRQGHDPVPASEPERSGRARGLFRRRRTRRGEPAPGEHEDGEIGFGFMAPLEPSEPGEDAPPLAPEPAPVAELLPEPASVPEQAPAPEPAPAPEQEPAPAPEQAPDDALDHLLEEAGDQGRDHAAGHLAHGEAVRALEAFNLSEHPKRLSGIARALGAPLVSVLPSVSGGDMVRLTVAWEICWYRYEVDLSDHDPMARLIAEGMELAELPPEERLANARADERGELVLALRAAS